MTATINTTNFFTHTVDPDVIQNSPHQPETRTDTSGPNNRLKASIKDHGLQYPPLVTRLPDGSLQLIDGHRRIKAIKDLGINSVTVIVANGNADDLFADVSANVKALNASQWLEVYLKGGMVGNSATRTNIKKLEETAGREFLVRLKQSGLSPTIWQVAGRFMKYTGLNGEPETKAQVLEWLLNHKLSRKVSTWISGQNSAKELAAAFEANKPIK